MRTRCHQSAAFVLALLLLVGLALGGGMAAAQNSGDSVTVVVVGVAPVQSGNTAAAREAALSNGMLEAVALAAVEILSPEGFAANFKKIGELLLEHPDAFIQEFKVLSEAAGAKQYRVLVQATVLGGAISDRASAAAPVGAKPAAAGGILLLIAEQEPGQPSARYWWGSEGHSGEFLAEAAAGRALRDKNLAVLDSRIARRQETVEWASFDRADLTVQEAAALGKSLNAELVVVGKVSVEAEKGAAAAGVHSFRGAFDARVVRAETAQEIGRVVRSSAAGGSDAAQAVRQALTGAGTVGGEALATEISISRQRREGGSSQVRVVVEGTGNLAHFVRFRKTLAGLAGVEGIRVKDMKPTATTLLVTFKGGAPELASILRRQSYDGFGVVVTETGEGSLKVALVAG